MTSRSMGSNSALVAWVQMISPGNGHRSGSAPGRYDDRYGCESKKESLLYRAEQETGQWAAPGHRQ